MDLANALTTLSVGKSTLEELSVATAIPLDAIPSEMVAKGIANQPKSKVWTKLVSSRNKDKGWEYTNVNFYLLRIFLLNWKRIYKENACKPKAGDLIILRQYGCVSHIVRVMNDTLYDDEMYGEHEYNISRLVQLIWITDWNRLTTNKEFFGCKINFPRNGKVYSMEKFSCFQDFPENLSQILTDYGKHLPALVEKKIN
ncbi:MAG: hypothetical protein HC903_26275 [Methylacidiphilales bacterium]|nr:hypothetical protein [Candidatus Methylacidiphilales bacterium]